MTDENVWQKQFSGLARSLTIGERTVEKGTAYLYRVGLNYYESAFAAYVSLPDQDWTKLMRRSLELYKQSAAGDDCSAMEQYPFNLSRLYMELFLGSWLLGETPDPDWLNQSINLSWQGIRERKFSTVSNYLFLVQCLLLNGDAIELNQIWDSIGDKLSSELGFFKSISTADTDFWKIYKPFISRMSSPTDQPANFYLTSAYIVNQRKISSEPIQVLLQKLSTK